MTFLPRAGNWAALWVVPAALLTGCASEQDSEELHVFAAASLHEGFHEIGERYTEETGQAVRFSYAGSSTLVEQLAHGAPADVLVTADEATFNDAAAEGLVTEPEVIAYNELVLITAPESTGLTSLDDVVASQARLVVCAHHVPCGAATEEAAENAGVELNPVSEAMAVTDVLGAVESGEAEAGLVYASDATDLDSDQVHSLGEEAPAPNAYPAATVTSGSSAEGASEATPEAAEDFLSFLQEDEAQSILREEGFQ